LEATPRGAVGNPRLAAAEALTRAVTEAVAAGDWVAALAAARGLEAFVGTLAGRSDPVEAEVTKHVRSAR
jgi:hypothetical protein